jgi:type 1 glutamine amidotransferase
MGQAAIRTTTAWYRDALIGAQFATTHQQPGTVKIEDTNSPIPKACPIWQRAVRDEWYAFGTARGEARVPHSRGRRRVDLRSAARRWARIIRWCGRTVGKGPVFYSAIGHSAETTRNRIISSCLKTPSPGLSASRARRGALRNMASHTLFADPRARTGSRGAWCQHPVRARIRSP